MLIQNATYVACQITLCKHSSN